MATTMVITTLLFFVLVRKRWRWPFSLALAVSGFFFCIDLAFWGANVVKIPDGGWFPLAIAAIVFTGITTWRRGREILSRRLRSHTLSIKDFVAQVSTHPPVRVPGVAVFMFGDPERTPRRERLIAARDDDGMALWRERLFAFMSRNARRATDFFRLPPNRVIEVGAQVEL